MEKQSQNILWNCILLESIVNNLGEIDNSENFLQILPNSEIRTLKLWIQRMQHTNTLTYVFKCKRMFHTLPTSIVLFFLRRFILTCKHLNKQMFLENLYIWRLNAQECFD